MEEHTTTAAVGGTKKTREDYHNPRLSVDRRVDDLLGRMTLAEKAGMLFQTMIVSAQVILLSRYPPTASGVPGT
jgi:beta-glucosidase